MSHVAVSFESPEYTADVDAIGPLPMLEAIRILGLEKKTRFYQRAVRAGTGNPAKKTTPFYPRSPYAAAKMYAYPKSQHMPSTWDESFSQVVPKLAEIFYDCQRPGD